MPDPAYGYHWRALRLEAKRIYPPTCHLCHGAIDMTLSGRDQYGWTLDHLYPVTIHGNALPDISQVRPAHRKCNERRGARALTPSPRSEQW
jgi:hypothetical protein